MSPNVNLTVNGSKYSGWKSININLGLEQLAGTFELIVTEKWPDNPTARKIRPGEACTVDIDGRIIITGYIDDVMPSFDSKSHTLTINGRDKTGDLVDCSAIYKSGQWSNKKLDVIASNLCEPFGIKVIVNTDLGDAFVSADIKEGETVFETIDRLAKQRGVLLTSDGIGNLVITRAGNERLNGLLKEGQNIKSASGTFSIRDRYSSYIGKGQHAGSNELNGLEASEPTANVNDSGVNRYRPLIIYAEDNATPESLKKRVTWQRNINYGRGTSAEVVVVGWKNNGLVWQFNKLQKIESESLGVDGELLISNVNYKLDDNGTTTILTLKRAEAYDVLDIPDTSEGGLFF
jgi:prophage tail gpP-like protein